MCEIRRLLAQPAAAAAARRALGSAACCRAAASWCRSLFFNNLLGRGKVQVHNLVHTILNECNPNSNAPSPRLPPACGEVHRRWNWCLAQGGAPHLARCRALSGAYTSILTSHSPFGSAEPMKPLRPAALVLLATLACCQADWVPFRCAMIECRAPRRRLGHAGCSAPRLLLLAPPRGADDASHVGADSLQTAAVIQPILAAGRM